VQSSSNVVHALGKLSITCESGETTAAPPSASPSSSADPSSNPSSSTPSSSTQSSATSRPPPSSLGASAVKILNAVTEHCESYVANATTQEVANVCWGMAQLRYPDALPYFKAVEANASYLVENGKPQEVSNIAWASAKINISIPLYLAAVEKQSTWLVEEEVRRTSDRTRDGGAARTPRNPREERRRFCYTSDRW